jgi:hypothetical protein
MPPLLVHSIFFTEDRMAIYQRLVNFNTQFDQLRELPIIINDVVDNTEEDKERIKEMITTRYNGDMITLLPSCRCGMVKGEFSVGVRCNYCGTTVSSSLEDEIQSSIWFAAPDGVHKLINPHVLLMLKNRFKKSGFSVIQWICDNTYRSTTNQPPVIEKLIASGMVRGYNNFVENYESILEYLFSMKEFQLPKGETDYLKILLAKAGRTVFSDYMPLPNKSILIIEKTNVGTYVDPIIVEGVDAIRMLVSIDNNYYNQQPKAKENRTIKALFKFSDFYEMFYKSNVGSKEGQFRRHIYGSRTNFSCRAVVSSLTGTHAYDEIHVPWGIGITAFRFQLKNKLMKLGMDNNSAIGMLNAHVNKFHPLLNEMLKEFIRECPFKGIPTLIARNPSLKQGSVQSVYVTVFKTDPTDTTIGISILIVKACNADFDGDEMNVSIAVDNYMAKKWEPLRPIHNILELSAPGKISGNIAIPKPLIATTSNWLAGDN